MQEIIQRPNAPGVKYTTEVYVPHALRVLDTKTMRAAREELAEREKEANHAEVGLGWVLLLAPL